ARNSYFFESPLNNPLDLSKIKGLQIPVGPGVNEPGSRKGFVLQSISLVKKRMQYILHAETLGIIAALFPVFVCFLFK
ncbi:hypothetical protein, partial [Anditalea andensis]|uniref:hypothetical protein n=1 Tax=Anditalea andensis TaxID=1048983 RepID=UPI000554550F